MGTVGPGSIHLLNGLYDAKKSHAPVLALCGQVPLAELGSDFFQEVDNDALFRDVAVFRRTITSPDQLPGLLEQAVQSALAERGVAVLTLPGDVGGQDLAERHAARRASSPPARASSPTPGPLHEAATAIDAAGSVTLLVGMRRARGPRRGARARRPAGAPMVLTLKAKEGLERDNPFQVGQTGLIGNPAARQALEGARAAAHARHRLPLPRLVPGGQGRRPGRHPRARTSAADAVDARRGR